MFLFVINFSSPVVFCPGPNLKVLANPVPVRKGKMDRNKWHALAGCPLHDSALAFPAHRLIEYMGSLGSP